MAVFGTRVVLWNDISLQEQCGFVSLLNSMTAAVISYHKHKGSKIEHFTGNNDITKLEIFLKQDLAEPLTVSDSPTETISLAFNELSFFLATRTVEYHL